MAAKEATARIKNNKLLDADRIIFELDGVNHPKGRKQLVEFRFIWG